MLPEHKKFNKIYRYQEQRVIVSEKIDGTNGLIYIDSENSIIKAGSRNRWIDVENDNYGFARWVEDNKEDLYRLGDGWHYGEWWGLGIQRGYGMDKKVFSLFNTGRWLSNPDKPDCCDVVPLLFVGTQSEYDEVDYTGELSQAALKYGVEFDRVEGHAVWFNGTQKYMKRIFDK